MIRSTTEILQRIKNQKLLNKQTGFISMLTGKKIVIGVTGSIAAYKAAYLVRLLVKENAEVKVMMPANMTSWW